MTKQVQRRRGTATQHTSFTGAEGELSVNTTNKSVHVHDGSTAGGIELARKDGSNVAFTSGTLDGVTIGGTTAGAGTFTNLTATGTTTLAGASTSANITFGDNTKAIFGAGNDLQIYHDGSNSIIKDNGAGDLRIMGSDDVRIVDAVNEENMARFNRDGAVTLYYDNAAKLATTSTGIDVTGTVTADGLTVDGNVNIDDAVPILRLDSPATTWAGGEDLGGLDWYTKDTSGSGPAVMARIYSESSGANTLPIPNMIFQTSSADVSLKDRMKIAGNGDISLYEDTGTTPKLFWDASAENLNIGTTTGTESLSIKDNAGFQISFGNTSASSIGAIGYDNNDKLKIYGNGATRMTIDSSGNVGIGVTSPTSVAANYTTLHLDGSSGSGIHLTKTTSGTTATDGSHLFNAGGDFYVSHYEGGNIIFSNGASATERMRIDSSGNLLVGQSSTTTVDTSSSVTGYSFLSTGRLGITRSEGVAVALNRLTSDGAIAEFKKDGTAVGSIGVDDNASDTNKTIYISSGNSASSLDVGFKFDWSANQITPCQAGGANRDNAVDMGSSSVRFDDIYATNALIQTSDQNEKQDIAELTDAEQRVAVAAKGLLRKFRWKDAVAEKGDEARTHFGIIAQDLQAAFAAEGLDAGDYAMFIHTTWTDEETGEEKSRMGVRYSELLAFIIAAI